MVEPPPLRIACVLPPRGERSGIADYTRHLLPYLAERSELRCYALDPDAWALGWNNAVGGAPESLEALEVRGLDQILFQIGNETSHAALLPWIERYGGTIVLHDWVLFDLAVAAYPELQRGGWRGGKRALAEGGPGEFLRWMKARRGRRPQGERAGALARTEGPFLEGWHEPEEGGRWTSETALFRVERSPGERTPGMENPPHGDAAELRIDLVGIPGRSLRVLHRGTTIVEHEFEEGALEVGLRVPVPRGERVLLAIESDSARTTREQRRAGDRRKLGVFVRSMVLRVGDRAAPVDLGTRSVGVPGDAGDGELAGARFELPFNRSVVRQGDAFLVHSPEMGRRILDSRNESTPIRVVPHGVERRWHDEPRAATRAALDVPSDERRDFWIGSFGAVQAHKRIDVLLEALSLARREASDLRLVLIGAVDSRSYDLEAALRRHGLGEFVRATGYVPEVEAWRWIHACDVMAQLRGPSTGGASGGLHQSLGLGRGVIVSDIDENAELPEDCLVRIPQGDAEPRLEVEALARTLVELRGDPDRLRRLESAAREAVESRLHWSQVADAYIEHMHLYPRARASRPSFFRMATERFRERYAKAAERDSGPRT